MKQYGLSEESNATQLSNVKKIKLFELESKIIIDQRDLA